MDPCEPTAPLPEKGSARGSVCSWIERADACIAGCPAEPDQHEVGRVMHGSGTWARISVSAKGRLDAGTRDAWLRRLDEARLVARTP